MSKEYKHVTNVTSRHGLMSSRVEVILKKGTELPLGSVESIAYAVDNLISGRQVVLSGKEISFSGHTHSETLTESKYNVLLRKYSELEEENKELRKERDEAVAQSTKLQAIVDGVDDAFLAISRNSTRGKAVQKRREEFARARGYKI